MRDLTALEINQFDFTGRVPDLNVPGYRTAPKAAAKLPARKFKLNVKRPAGKRRTQIGLARTA